MKEMYQKNNMRAATELFIRLAYHTVLISASFWFFMKSQYVIATLLAVPHWMMYSFVGSAGLSHELFHNSVFSKEIINKNLYKFFMILNWENYNYFEKTHWLHHKITLDEKDPKSIFKHIIEWPYLIQLFTFDIRGFKVKIKYIVRNAFGIIDNKKSENLFPMGSLELQKVASAARTIIMFHSITALVFALTGNWWMILLVNLSPFIFSFFNRFLGFSQHYGLSADNSKDYYSNCRSVILPRFWSFFYSNMNYHVEHHIYPQIPYYNIPKVHEMIKSRAEYKNLSFGWKGLVFDLKRKGIFGHENK